MLEAPLQLQLQSPAEVTGSFSGKKKISSLCVNQISGLVSAGQIKINTCKENKGTLAELHPVSTTAKMNSITTISAGKHHKHKHGVGKTLCTQIQSMEHFTEENN